MGIVVRLVKLIKDLVVQQTTLLLLIARKHILLVRIVQHAQQDMLHLENVVLITNISLLPMEYQLVSISQQIFIVLKLLA